MELKSLDLISFFTSYPADYQSFSFRQMIVNNWKANLCFFAENEAEFYWNPFGMDKLSGIGKFDESL